MAEAPNAFLDFIARYGPAAGEEGPIRMATEVFGAKLDPWQERVLRAYGKGERRISIRACHGPGKTYIAAIITWHHILCRFPQKAVATAPSRAQLEDALVSEIVGMAGHLPGPLRDLVDITNNRIELKAAPEESFFSARTARAESPEALQGVHSQHVLLIADEASGVPEKIFEAAAGSMSGHHACTLLLGNPVRGSGFFFDTHHKLKDMWFTVHVSAFDSSRVTEDFCLDIERRYGKESNAYRIRVLGEFPLSDDDTVIPLHLVESARHRDLVIRPNLREVWGLDIARSGRDLNALVRRSSMAVNPDMMAWHSDDLMKTAGRVKAKYDETPPSDRPELILIDVIGLGAGVVDRLRELKLPVRGINVSESAAMSERFLNLRSELWDQAREWLAGKNVALPRCDGGCHRDCLHERLAGELVQPLKEFNSAGKMQVEGKKDMRKRGIPSPNLADAFCLTFASSQATLLSSTRDVKGWGSPVGWDEPIRRPSSRV